MVRTTLGWVVELYTEAQKWPMASDLRSAIYTEHRLPVCPSRLIGIDDRTRAPVLDFEVLRSKVFESLAKDAGTKSEAKEMKTERSESR